jgi:hypothetical protein
MSKETKIFIFILETMKNYDVPVAKTSLKERQLLTRSPKTWCDFSAEEIKIIKAFTET